MRMGLFRFFPFGQLNESLPPKKKKSQREWLKLLEFDFIYGLNIIPSFKII